MPSKPVIRHQRFAAALRSSMDRHEDAMLEGLQERLGPLLGEGAVIDAYKTVHRFFLDTLAAREDAMVTADEAHLAEEMDDRGPRRLRDQSTLDVRNLLVGVRRAATGHFGTEEAAEFLNFEGLTSRDPVTVFRQGRRVMERLRSTELAMPTSQLSEALDREGWAARLEPALAALQRRLDTVGTEERELILTRTTKKEAVDDFKLDSRALAGILEGFMILAGRRDLSDEVRPGRLNRRARAAAEEQDPSSEGGPDGEGSPEAESPDPSGPPTTTGGEGSPPPRQTGAGS